MALLIQQTSTTKQASTAPFKIARFKVAPFNRQTKLMNIILTLGAAIGAVSLSACQTAPTTIKTSPAQISAAQNQQPAAKPSVTATQTPVIKGDDKHSTEPYQATKQPAPTIPSTEAEQAHTPPIQSPIITHPDSQDTIILTPSREDYILSEPSIPSHNELLERARQNSQQRSQQSTVNNSTLPAFRNLMQTGTEQLKSGNLNGAESSFTRAQRLAPKSSAVYFYLAQVALKKNQPRKAEAMARRGLTVAQDSTRRRALWQIILQSGQAQGNARVINEAKQALR